MSTERQMQIFELIAVHGCTQQEAGGMIDPPVSQSTVNRDLNDLFTTHPELEAVKEYLNDNSVKNPTSPLASYDTSMDSFVKAKF
jgi:hypothetical protein